MAMDRRLLAIAVFGAALVFALPAAAEKVVCFGDSATEGAVDLSFPDYLEFFIDSGDGEVANEGDGGETSAEGYWRLLWLVVSLQYIDADVWTYWEGGNDLIDWVEDIDPYVLYDPASPTYPYRDELDDKLAEIAFNLEAGVTLLQLTGVDVILGTYFDVVPWLQCDASPIGFLTPGLATRASHYQEELNETIRAVAQSTGADLNDMGANLGMVNGHLINYHDCFHMNALGNFWVALSWWLAVAPYI